MPDTDTDNTDRAEWAREALARFMQLTRYHPADLDTWNLDAVEEALGDLLGNFIHLVGPEVFERCLERGRGYYTDEINEEN